MFSFEIIDAYAHCGPGWGHVPEEHKPKNANQPISVFKETMSAAGVGRTVIAQHTGGDNEYIEAIVIAEPEKFAGMFVLDHAAPTAERDLNQYAEDRIFRGIRVFQPMWNERPNLVASAAKLGLVIMNSGGTVEQVKTLLDGNPEARVVFIHLGGRTLEAPKPVQSLAAYPAVYIQISGLELGGAKYPCEEVYPTIEGAARAFDSSQLIWGSDYPVSDAHAYKEDLELLIEGRIPVSSDAIPAIAGANARVLYFE